MKVWMKISLLCMCIYLLVLGTSGIIMIEKNYSDALSKEIETSFKEEEYAQKITDEYISLETASLMSNDNTKTTHYSNKDLNSAVYKEVSKLVKPKGTWLEMYDENGTLVSSDFPAEISLKRDEINLALKGEKNYIIRKINGSSYLITSGMLQDSHVISLIKEISYIGEKKHNEYLFFFQLLFLGLIFLLLISPVMSRYITMPIEYLSCSVREIMQGNYSERVKIKGNGEIKELASLFNVMVTEIEKRIIELTLQGEKKQRFIDDLIHEIRTPLTSIIGYSDFLMKNEYSGETLTKALTNINHEGKRLLEISDKLMELILLKNHNVLNFKEQNVNELLEEIRIDMESKHKDTEMEIKVEKCGLIENISMDRDLIKCVITNLIDNAVKASKNKGIITIGTCRENGRQCIYVKDNGKGMPAEELDKIVEPFYRIDKSRSRRDGGAGLGLDICSEIVKAHSAEMLFESEIGSGTTVKILF